MKKKFYNIVIAEIGSNHNGSVLLAKKHILGAKKAGADYVKFQMHIAEEESLKDAPSPDYFKKEDRFSYFKRINFSFENWKKIKKYCKAKKIGFLCSPFSIKAVDVLERLNVELYKVPSGELTNIPLIQRLKKTKKHVIISTGMSDYREIDQAAKILKKNFSILQCTSMYPCPIIKVGLNVFKNLKKKYKCEIGYSDHTLDFSSAFALVANGASIIEKHFTLSKELYGSDAKHSMEQKEFKFYVNTIKDIWIINKSFVDKDKLTIFKKMKKIFEKSIVTSNIVKKNTILKLRHLNFKKPGDGIRADMYKKIIGKKIKLNLPKDTKLKHSHFY
tara:strand:+ start:329 stop:1324 length:996 start_codon:yes stop_codon:yes gene_type:complete